MHQGVKISSQLIIEQPSPDMKQSKFIQTLYVPDNLYQRISSYLYQFSRSKELLQNLLPQSLFVPDHIILYPKNRISLQYSQDLQSMQQQKLSYILKQRLLAGKPLQYADTFHIVRELLLIFIILHRNSFITPGLSSDQVYIMNETVKLSLIGDSDTFVQHFWQQEEEIIQISSSSLINQLYEHQVSQMSIELMEFKRFLVKLAEETQIAENPLLKQLWIEFLIPQSNSMAQIYSKLLIIMKIYKEQQNIALILSQKSQIQSILNPFSELNNYLASCYQNFIMNDQFMQIFGKLISEQNSDIIQQRIENFVQTNIFGIRSMQDVKLLKYNMVNTEIITIKQKKMQSTIYKQIITEVSKDFPELVIFNINSVDEYVQLLLSYVKLNIQNTILDPECEIFHQHEMKLEDITQMSFNTYNWDKMQNKEERMKQELKQCAQYLGQAFPEFLQLLSLEPDYELNIFDCLTGGMYLLMMTRYLLRPYMKICLIFDEEKIFNLPELDRNLLYAVIVSLNAELTPNTKILYLQSLEQPENKQNVKVREMFMKYIQKSTAIKTSKTVSTEFISDSRQIISFISGKTSNSPELLYVIEQIQNVQCDCNNQFCLFSQLKKYLMQSGAFYIDQTSEFYIKQFVQLTRYLIESQQTTIKQAISEALQQTQTLVSFSVDYWMNTQPCQFKTSAFIELLSNLKIQNQRNKNLRSILLASSLIGKQLTIDFFGDLCKIPQDEVMNHLETLTKQRIMSKVDQSYQLTELDQIKQIITELKCDDIWFVAESVFNFLVQKYDLLNGVDKYMENQEAQAELYSQIWRIFRCFDISDKIDGQIPIFQKDKQMTKYITEQQIILLKDNPNFSTLYSIDQVLSQSQDMLAISEDEEDFIFDFKLQGYEKQSLEQQIKKDNMRNEIQKIAGILLRIKTSLLLISCLSSNQSNEQAKPKFIQNVQAIYISNNAPFIQYILKRTTSLITTLQNIINATDKFKCFRIMVDKLELSCQWYQFVNMPLDLANNALNQLCKSNIAPAGMALIAWRLIKTGYVEESKKFCFYYLSYIMDYDKIYKNVEKLIKYQSLKQDNGIIQYIQTSICRYYDVFLRKIPFQQKDFPFIEAVLLLDALISACRITGDYPLQIIICTELLHIGIPFGCFQLANIAMLICSNYLLSNKQFISPQSAEVQILNNIVQDISTVIIDSNKIRIQKMFQSELQTQYEDLMLDMNADHDYQPLCIEISQSYSFSSVLEVLLLKQRIPEQQYNNFFNQILLLMDQSTTFDCLTSLRLFCFSQQFLQSLRDDMLFQLQNLRLQLDFSIRIAENKNDGRIFSIFGAFVEAFCAEGKIPLKIKFVKPNQIEMDKSIFVFEDFYQQQLQNNLFYGLIMMQIHLLHAKLSGEKLIELFLVQQLNKYQFVLNSTPIWRQIVEIVTLKPENQLSNVLNLQKIEENDSHQFKIELLNDTILKKMNLKNSLYQVFHQTQEKPYILIRNVVQRIIQDEENNYGFIYFWSDNK